jgi:hypothetical protein
MSDGGGRAARPNLSVEAWAMPKKETLDFWRNARQGDFTGTGRPESIQAIQESVSGPGLDTADSIQDLSPVSRAALTRTSRMEAFHVVLSRLPGESW